MERWLAAILAADVVGYSRLMEADEAGTLDRLKALRAEAVDPVIATALYVELGRLEDACETSTKVRQMDPQFSADTFVKSQGLKSATHGGNLLAALRKAKPPE